MCVLGHAPESRLQYQISKSRIELILIKERGGAYSLITSHDVVDKFVVVTKLLQIPLKMSFWRNHEEMKLRV